MTRLSVNVNKIALLRNARGSGLPDLLRFSQDAIRFGAQGITVHPRPDGRHVLKQDVYDLKAAINVELNVEGYPSGEFIEMVCKVKPAQCTLVPDPPNALTSSTGWDMKDNLWYLQNAVDKLKKQDIRASVFINPDLASVEAAAKTKTHAIEFYTGPYAADFDRNSQQAVKPYKEAAKLARELGLQINAGHDLNLKNLRFFKESMPFLDEVSIGHAIVCDALYMGLEKTIADYLACLAD